MLDRLGYRGRRQWLGPWIPVWLVYRRGVIIRLRISRVLQLLRALSCCVGLLPIGAGAADTPLALVGSSTAAGVGASSPNSSWAGLLSSWQVQTGRGRILNLAEPGALTSTGLCVKDRLVNSAPARSPRNSVETALALGSKRIILSFPSNDLVAGWPASRTLENVARMAACARAAGATIAVMSSLPRAHLTPAQLKTMAEINQALRKTYGACFLDVHTALADAGSIDARPEYSAGDGIHFNDEGHRVLYVQVRDFLESGRCF